MLKNTKGRVSKNKRVYSRMSSVNDDAYIRKSRKTKLLYKKVANSLGAELDSITRVAEIFDHSDFETSYDYKNGEITNLKIVNEQNGMFFGSTSSFRSFTTCTGLLDRRFTYSKSPEFNYLDGRYEPISKADFVEPSPLSLNDSMYSNDDEYEPNKSKPLRIAKNLSIQYRRFEESNYDEIRHCFDIWNIDYTAENDSRSILLKKYFNKNRYFCRRFNGPFVM